MAQPVQESKGVEIDTSEFVRRSDFDEWAIRITSALDDLSTDVRNAVDERVAKERVARKKEVTALRAELNGIIQGALTGIDKKLTDLDENSCGLKSEFSELKGEVSQYNTSMRAREKTVAAAERRLDERNEEQDRRIEEQDTKLLAHRSDIDLMMTALTTLNGSMLALRTTIHGDSSLPDGPQSIFGTLAILETKLHTVITNQTKLQSGLVVVQHELKEQRETWMRRRKRAAGFFQALFKNKWFYILVFSILIGIIFGEETLLAALTILRGE